MKVKMTKENKFWNFFAIFYDSFMEKTIKSSYKNMYEKIIERINKSNDLLEMASGTGDVSIAISNHVNNIVAIDFAENMVNIASKKAKEKKANNIKFKIGNCCSLKFRDKSFDTIICSNALHLINEPELALKEMHRVLRDEGEIIVPTFCHGENIKSRLSSYMMTIVGFRARNRWSVESFKKFIENNNFRLTDFKVYKGIIPLVYLCAEKINN